MRRDYRRHPRGPGGNGLVFAVRQGGATMSASEVADLVFDGFDPCDLSCAFPDGTCSEECCAAWEARTYLGRTS